MAGTTFGHICCELRLWIVADGQRCHASWAARAQRPPNQEGVAHHSRASASTGSSLAAERAGMKPKITPIRLAEAMASMIDSAE